MTQNKYLKKFSRFWLKPMIIGFLISLGYNGTKQITSTGGNTISKVNTSKVIKKDSHKYKNDLKKINSLKESFVNEKSAIKKKESSSKNLVNKKKDYIIKEVNDVQKEKVKLLSKENKNKDNMNTQINEFFSLEAKEYFEKYNLQELLKTLPSE